MGIQKNEMYTVRIEGYASEGYGVCRVNGFVVFVKGAAAGDECEIRIVKVLKNLAYAKIEQIFVPSPARVTPACPVFPKCGGCDFFHISYEEELRMKKERVEDALFRIGGFELKAEEVAASPKLFSYRNKAQFPVASVEGLPVTGFYRKHSHEVVPTEVCLIQSETANKLAQAARTWIAEYSIPVYDEIKKSGVVRHVYVRTSSKGESFLCIIAAADELPFSDRLIKAAKAACPSLRGIILNINKAHGNAILGGEERVLWGDGFIEDTLCGLFFRISPLSFFQVNHGQAEKLYSRAIEYAALSPSDTALDLYCGTGTITLCLAKKCARAIGVEVVPEAIRDAEKNAEINHVENVRFLCMDAGKAAEKLIRENASVDVITVDPPRRGMDEGTVSAILDLAPKRIVYISCDPATLARDCKLLSEGGYIPSRLSVFDMFPRTIHTEVVCLLERGKR